MTATIYIDIFKGTHTQFCITFNSSCCRWWFCVAYILKPNKFAPLNCSLSNHFHVSLCLDVMMMMINVICVGLLNNFTTHFSSISLSLSLSPYVCWSNCGPCHTLLFIVNFQLAIFIFVSHYHHQQQPTTTNDITFFDVCCLITSLQKKTINDSNCFSSSGIEEH